jgi:hypothetical protein
MIRVLLIECLNGYRLKEKLVSNLLEFTVPLGVPEIIREGYRCYALLVMDLPCVVVADAAIVLDNQGVSAAR